MKKDKNRKEDKKHKEELRESRGFIFLLIITAVLVISPVLLYIPILNKAVAVFLYPLKTQEFKSVYVEAISALIGTFLAITGALWTQRKIDSREDVKKNRNALRVVYYDFKFVYDDLKKMFVKEDGSGKFHLIEINKENVTMNMSKYGVEDLYIDPKWITHVAELSDIFEDDELEQVFKMYGEISTIKTILENDCLETDRLRNVLEKLFDMESGNENAPFTTFEGMISTLQTKIEDLHT